METNGQSNVVINSTFGSKRGKVSSVDKDTMKDYSILESITPQKATRSK